MQVSPGKGKLGEGVGCEVADGRVGQELHHLQVTRKNEKGDYAKFKEKRKRIMVKLKKEVPKVSLLTMQTSSGEELNIIGERCIAELLLIAVKKSLNFHCHSHLGGWGSRSSWLGV